MEIVLLAIVRNDSIWDTMSAAVDFKFEDDRFSFQICAYRVSLSVSALLANASGWLSCSRVAPRPVCLASH